VLNNLATTVQTLLETKNSTINNFVSFHHFITKFCAVTVKLFSIILCKYCLNRLRFSYLIMKCTGLRFSSDTLYTYCTDSSDMNSWQGKMLRWLLMLSTGNTCNCSKAPVPRKIKPPVYVVSAKRSTLQLCWSLVLCWSLDANKTSRAEFLTDALIGESR